MINGYVPQKFLTSNTEQTCNRPSSATPARVSNFSFPCIPVPNPRNFLKEPPKPELYFQGIPVPSPRNFLKEPAKKPRPQFESNSLSLSLIPTGVPDFQAWAKSVASVRSWCELDHELDHKLEHGTFLASLMESWHFVPYCGGSVDPESCSCCFHEGIWIHLAGLIVP